MATATRRQPKTRYTIAEYLALEERTGEKWEYFDGEAFPWEAMAGVTPPHAMLCSRVGTMITNGLDRDRCNVFDSGLKLGIEALRRYRYSDLTVICGNLEKDRNIPHAILNPTVLVEVTSKKSFEADYTSKAEQYMRHIPSLRDYLIVVQHELFLTIHSRTDARAEWTVLHASRLEAEVTIPSVGVTLPLAKVYRNIVWRDGKAVVELQG